MKIQIVIHLLPHEIDEFERQLCELSKNTITDDEITLDVTLNLNVVNWGSSKIPKNFFIDKFNFLKKYITNTNWCKNQIFEIDESKICNGINDKRRNSIRKYANNVDAFLWIDSDIVFPYYALPYIISAAKKIDKKYYIISPQLTKLWDNTWDCLVNKSFIKYPCGNEKIINPHNIVYQNYGNINLIQNEQIKFGGGLFTLFNSNLLKHTDIPDELGSYGVDDTYIMFCAQIMKKNKIDITQYILENVIVAENFLFKDNFYKKYYEYNIEKEYFRTKAQIAFSNCINSFKFKNQYK